MCARNYHSYTHLILALSIVRKPTVWGFISSKIICMHDIGLPNGVVFVFVRTPPTPPVLLMFPFMYGIQVEANPPLPMEGLSADAAMSAPAVTLNEVSSRPTANVSMCQDHAMHVRTLESVHTSSYT